MADNIIQVNVTSSKPKRVSVSSSNVQNEITASADTSKYFSGLARNWATSETLVENTDYSSKYYANKAKANAENSKMYAESTQTLYNDFIDNFSNYQGLLEETTQSGVTTINETSTQAIETINNSVDDVIADINKEFEEEKQEIEDLANLIKNNAEEIANRTSFAMFDTVLKDHVLTFEESKGLALQGTYVYKEAVAGSRYGYADFYNKCLEEYQNAEALSWEQPKITSNGVMGGDSFAVEASYEYTNQPAWQAFDGSDSTVYGSNTNNTPFWVTFYEPSSLKVSNLKLLGRTDVATTNANIEIQACNDNETWETLTSLTQTIAANAAIEIPVNSTNYYKYYRINFVSFSMPSTAYNCNLREVVITATTKAIRQNPNGHIFYDIAQKDTIDDLFEQTGMAWLYGIDQENERIYLPRNNWFEQMTADGSEVGKSIEAGLPNITGTFGCRGMEDRNITQTGALYKAGTTGAKAAGDTSTSVLMGLDASRSSDVYGNSDTVQPNAVKKLLYICVGNTETTSAVTDVVEVTTTENDTLPLLHHIPADELLEHPSWLRSAGQWNDGNVYTTVYEYLVAQYVNGTEHTDTLTSSNGTEYTVTYKTVKGKKVVDYANVGQVDAVYYAIGSAWYYVINQDDMTFRLPMSHNTECYTSDPTRLGLDVSAGLPNITGRVITASGANMENNPAQYGEGALSATVERKANWTAGSSSGNWTGAALQDISFNASKSNPIYGNSDTVTSPHTEFYLYFKVANAVQDLELLDAGEVLEAVADKISRQDCKAYITETYQNGASWYRVYSDGWCEQGGTVQSIPHNTNTNINLLKSYKDTNYNCNAWCRQLGFAAQSTISVAPANVAYIQVYQANNASAAMSIGWEAKGFIA